MAEHVLVTGAAGFLGRHLTKNLLAQGKSVVAIVRDNTHPGLEGLGCSIVRGDVTDPAVCARAIADYEVTEVYHLAAQSIVSICSEDPISTLHVAVMGTAHLIQAVRNAGRPIKVVVMTSDKVYGWATPPYTEETPFDPRYAYEVSKACQDMVARMFHTNYQVDVRVVRMVNIYGPGDPNDTRLIPQTVKRALRGEPPLIHEGANSIRRQLIYVDDAVEALLCVMAKGVAGGAYCAGSCDEAMTVGEVIQAIYRQVGVSVPAADIKQRDARFQEIQEQAVNDAGTRRKTGWAPRIPFNEGIQRTVQWQQRRGSKEYASCSES